MDLMQWLLEEDTPGVALLARRHLLDEDPHSRRMRSLRRRCNDYGPVARMIKGVGQAIRAGDYQKYKGAYWTFLFLAEMQADGRDKNIRKLAEHVLDRQLGNGGFSPSGQPGMEIACLTANVLRSAVHFGYGDDQRVRAGYRRLMERILPHGGVPCIILNYVLQTSCKMTIPQTLRCMAIAPDGLSKKDVKKTRETLVQDMLDVGVYRYVRPDFKTFDAAMKKRPKGVTGKAFREQWLADSKVKKSELLPKAGWLKFRFPRSYNPDLIEAMVSLVELGVKQTAVLDDGLDQIERKRTKDGVWKMDESLNGKMLANVEQRGRPSKWITVRALQVLRHFGREAGL